MARVPTRSSAPASPTCWRCFFRRCRSSYTKYNFLQAAGEGHTDRNVHPIPVYESPRGMPGHYSFHSIIPCILWEWGNKFHTRSGTWIACYRDRLFLLYPNRESYEKPWDKSQPGWFVDKGWPRWHLMSRRRGSWIRWDKRKTMLTKVKNDTEDGSRNHNHIDDDNGEMERGSKCPSIRLLLVIIP